MTLPLVGPLLDNKKFLFLFLYDHITFVVVVLCYWSVDKMVSYLIGGVMVSILTSSVVDREFEPQSGQTKDYNIGMCCFSTIKACK